MGKLFGTDGIRGIAGSELTAELAFRVGRSAAELLKRNGNREKVLIGRDTRASCDFIEAALTAGLCGAGIDVMPLGVVPTPAVAYLTVAESAGAGIMVSASHNPFDHNGIKIFNSGGYKLSDELEDEIEAGIDKDFEQVRGAEVGRIIKTDDPAGRYIDYIGATAQKGLAGLRVAVDCANGAASATAARIFGGLGCKADIFSDRPDGVNINAGCGSTHLEALGEIVKSGGYDAGVAFDGDADRCLIVDEKGAEVDGDRMMAVCGVDMMKDGRLAHNTIVATVMSNLGFHVYCRERGINVLRAPVGDRHVLEEMIKGGYSLGGEQSGHLIFKDLMTTGDGQLSALRFLVVLASCGRRVSELVADVPSFPQVLINVTVSPAAKAALASDARVKDATDRALAELGEDGRILVRPSGTEPMVRVMAEGKDAEKVAGAAEALAEIIRNI